jgi:biopolymer transport protein ExbB/TolQ
MQTAQPHDVMRSGSWPEKAALSRFWHHPMVGALLALGWTALCLLGDRAWGRALEDLPGLGSLFRFVHRHGMLGTTIAAVTLWILLFELGGRAAGLLREQSAVRKLESEVSALLRQNPRAAGPLALPASRAARRASLVALLARGHSEPTSDPLGSISAVEEATLENSYALARALIWTLPVIGFVGTAAGMASAIEGFSGALRGGQAPKLGAPSMVQALVDSLASVVIPGLAHAFSLTMFALVSSVLTHVCLTAVHAWDVKLLNELDDCSVKLSFSLSQAKGPASRPDSFPESAIAILQGIAGELARLGAGETLAQLRQVGQEMAGSAQALKGAAQQLGGLGPQINSGTQALRDAAQQVASESGQVAEGALALKEAASELKASLDAPYVVTVRRGRSP